MSYLLTGDFVNWLIDTRRGVARSHWRPGTAGPTSGEGGPHQADGRIPLDPQANINPYAGPEGDDPRLALKPPTKPYTPKKMDRLEAIANTADRLQKARY